MEISHGVPNLQAFPQNYIVMSGYMFYFGGFIFNKTLICPTEFASKHLADVVMSNLAKHFGLVANEIKQTVKVGRNHGAEGNLDPL